MGFKLPKDTREYFKSINDRTDDGIKLKYLFDQYYLCLVAGLIQGKIGSTDKLESGDFVDYYVELYEDVNDIIAGLLIDAEMRRRDIIEGDKNRIENLILDIIDQHSKTRLNDKGINLLNQYAVTGMELIRENIARTSELETFLIHYYNLLNTIAEQSNTQEPNIA